MQKKILFITEILSVPFDEGMKNVAFSLHKNLAKRVELLSVTEHNNDVGNLYIKKVRLNKLFLSKELRRVIRDYSPDIILYMPETSITFNSFVRARLLRSIGKGARIGLFATLKRCYNPFQVFLIERFLAPNIVFLFGNFRGLSLKRLRTHTLPPAIDVDKFSVATEDEKVSLRKRYEIPVDKRVVLHVGHVRPTRNVSALIKVQRLKDVQVLIVGSTSTPRYDELKERLEAEGIIILDQYIANISEVYRLSDIYVFPVRDEIASINLPLSIIEAMACGLPVVTTRFGGVEGYFSEDEGFRYFDTDEELLRLVNDISMDGRANREKVRQFTWERLAGELIDALDETV